MTEQKSLISGLGRRTTAEEVLDKTAAEALWILSEKLTSLSRT
jgi:hypothetical protein